MSPSKISFSSMWSIQRGRAAASACSQPPHTGVRHHVHLQWLDESTSDLLRSAHFLQVCSWSND